MIETEAISEAIAQRYVETLTAFISIVRDAVTDGNSAQAALWQRKVLPMLEARLSTAKTAAGHFTIGDQQPLLDAALPLRFLARDLNGYSLDFAGAAVAEQFEERRRLVVYAAWQVGHAARVI